MQLVTRDLKRLESGSRKFDDLRRTTISHFCSLLLFAPSAPIERAKPVILSPSPSQLRIPQLLIEIPCPAKATLREIGKMNLVMRGKCYMEAGE